MPINPNSVVLIEERIFAIKPLEWDFRDGPNQSRPILVADAGIYSFTIEINLNVTERDNRYSWSFIRRVDGKETGIVHGTQRSVERAMEACNDVWVHYLKPFLKDRNPKNAG